MATFDGSAAAWVAQLHPPPARSAATGPSGGRSIQRLQLTPVVGADIPPNVARLATTRTTTTASTAPITSAVVLRRRSEASIPFVCKSASSSDNAARLSNGDKFCSSSANRSTKSWPIPGEHDEGASVAAFREAKRAALSRGAHTRVVALLGPRSPQADVSV